MYYRFNERNENMGIQCSTVMDFRTQISYNSDSVQCRKYCMLGQIRIGTGTAVPIQNCTLKADFNIPYRVPPREFRY